MIRCLCLFTLLLSLNLASAQHAESFVGAGVTNLFPIASLQLGSPIAERVTLQATLDTILIGNMLSADVVYALPLNQDFSLNLGGGPHFAQYFTGAGFGVHAITGVLYRPEAANVGVFLDVRPTLLDVAYPALDVFPRLGVNVYF